MKTTQKYSILSVISIYETRFIPDLFRLWFANCAQRCSLPWYPCKYLSDLTFLPYRELTFLQLVKYSPLICGNRSPIAVFWSAGHLLVSWAKWNRSTPSILIISPSTFSFVYIPFPSSGLPDPVYIYFSHILLSFNLPSFSYHQSITCRRVLIKMGFPFYSSFKLLLLLLF